VRIAYTGYDAAGAPRSGTVEATDQAEAREKLRARGVLVLELHEGGSAPRRRTGPRGKPADVAQFLRHLAVLVATGTPLAEALASQAEHAAEPRTRAMLDQLRAHVESGSALSEAMGSHTGYFDDVCRAMTAAGESSGSLGPMLERIANLMRDRLRIRRALLGAMIYPALLIGVGVVVVLGMLVLVFPRFEELFASLDTPVPPSTQLFLALSELLRGWWWAIVPGVALGAVAVAVAVRTPSVRRRVERAMLGAPRVGPLLRSFANARLARMLALMLQGQLPLLEALDLSARSLPSVEYRRLVGRARDAAAAGQPLADVFEADPLVHPLVRQGVRTGERTGRLADMMAGVADFLEEENDTTLRSLTSIIEPVLLIALGLVVGSIAVSMFLPLFDLTATASPH